ncbi:TOBE domain-containing protein [Streptomyces sp. CA-179760]|uniref:TOBE domain-containing protein n=1 Tax=Streptomyces sp. CA-179760 TaxID=3240054 RepID=UPI003D89EE83
MAEQSMHCGSPWPGRAADGISDTDDTLADVATGQWSFFIGLHRTTVPDQPIVITRLKEAPDQRRRIRNRLPGTVREVATGAAMASVRVSVEDGELTAAITKDAVTDLGLAEGSAVTVLLKSTEVSLATVRAQCDTGKGEPYAARRKTGTRRRGTRT